MLNLWLIFTQVLLPILVLIGLGWILDRQWQLSLATLVRLNIYLVVPAFIFYEVVHSSLSAGMAGQVMLFTLCIMAGMFVLSALIARACGYSAAVRRGLQLTTMFYNSGNYGVPLMTLAYPVLGPVLQVFVVLTQNISTFTVGLWLASAQGRAAGWRALLPMLRQVSLWAVAVALLVRWLHLPVQTWRWLWVPVEYLHSALVGVALVTLGVQLAQAKPVAHLPQVRWALGLRLVAAPLLAAVLIPLFPFQGETARIMILSAGFPTAVNVALLVHEFEGDSHFAATVVFYSTVLSLVTVTLLIAWLR